MDIRKLSEKSLTGSLLRISLATLFIVCSLCIICLIYSLINGDFPHSIYKKTVFHRYKVHSHRSTINLDIKKPSLLESIRDTYMGWKYGTEYFNVKYNRQNHPDKSMCAEKIQIVSPMTNWDTKIAGFSKNTGFMGKINTEDPKISSTWKERTFEYMKGTFNLPEPRDTVTFRRNADFLVKNILALYKGEKTDFNLRKHPIYIQYYPIYPNKNVSGYQASYEQMLQKKKTGCSYLPIINGLYISYDLYKKNYQISNQLVTTPLSTPKDKVGKEAAIRIAKKELKKQHKDKNIMPQYRLSPSLIDTLSSNIWKEYFVRYPEMKSPYYYYVQSIWHINFPWVWYGKIEGCDVTFDEDYAVNAYNGEVYGE